MADIKLRLSSGSMLTPQEVDDNFNNLNSAKLEGDSLTTDNVLVKWSSGDSKFQETGITVDDSDNISGFNYIDFDEIATPANPGADVLRLYAVDESGFGTLHFVNSDGIDYELGRDRIFAVRNNTGSTISKGRWVYITGSQGTVPTVALAQADSETTAHVLGIVVADISNNSFGRVLAAGDVQNIDTSSFSEGDTLYLSTSSAGDAQTTKPTGTDQIVLLGTVIKDNAGSGIIKVSPEAPSPADYQQLADVTGKQTRWVPAEEMTPTTTGGCAALAKVEIRANFVDLNVLDFDGTTAERAVFSMAMPKSWDKGTVSFQAFWTTAATDTDSVVWGLSGRAFSDNDTFDQQTSTIAQVTDAVQGAANDLLVSAESSGHTVEGSPADDDMIVFRVIRLVSDGSDTMAEDARLIGIKLFYTTDAPTDD